MQMEQPAIRHVCSGVCALLDYSDLRFESIRFPPKIGTSDSIVLVVGVCLPNHRSTDYRSWHGSGAPIFCEGARAVHGPQPGPPSHLLGYGHV